MLATKCAMAMLVAVVLLFAVIGATNKSKNSATKKYSAAEIKRGGYIINAVGACNDCHTPHVMTPQGPAPDMSRMLSGAPENEMVADLPVGNTSGSWMAAVSADMTAWGGPWGVSFSANLSPDSATGIGSWTESMFIAAIRNGKYWGSGRDLLPPMPWQTYRNMSDNDLGEMFAYLQSIKPVKNVVPAPIPPKH